MELRSVKVGIKVVWMGIIIPAMIRKYNALEPLNFIFAKAKEIMAELMTIRNTLTAETIALLIK